MLELKLHHVSKRGPWCFDYTGDALVENEYLTLSHMQLFESLLWKEKRIHICDKAHFASMFS